MLVIADGLEVDDRLVAATLARPEPALAVWKGRAAHDGAERIDPATHWAGVAVYPGTMVAETLANLGEWDLQATLLRAAFAGDRPSKVDAGAIGGAPVIWQAVRGDDDAARLTALELESGREANPDVVERLLQPFTTRAVARLVERQTSPSLPTALALLLGVAAIIGFATGWLWAGLIAAILAAALMPIGPALGRLRHDVPGSPWIPFAVEAGWYAGLGLWLARAHEAVGVAALFVILVGGRGGAIVFAALYQRVTGKGLATDAPRLAAFGASRNTTLWLLLPFAVLSAWWAGFVALAAYALATYALVVRRLHAHLPQQR